MCLFIFDRFDKYIQIDLSELSISVFKTDILIKSCTFFSAKYTNIINLVENNLS